MKIVSWHGQLRGLHGVSPTARLVMGELGRLADCRGAAICSIDWLVEATGRSRASVFRALGQLEELGLVRRHARRMNDRQAASVFELRFAPTASPSPEPMVEAVPLSLGDARPIGKNDNDGLREALRQAQASGWTGEAAQCLGATLVAEGPRQFWAPIQHAMASGMGFDEAVTDTIALAWQALRDTADDLIASRRPWALWTTIVVRQGLTRDVAFASRPIPVETLPDVSANDPAPVERDRWVSLEDFSGPLTRIVDALVSAGMDETIAWAGTRRIAEIACGDPGRRHAIAGADVRLADLGIDPTVARAWMTLLVGSRRGTTAGILSMDDVGLADRCADLVRQWKSAA